VDIVACPTCGRCQVDLPALVRQIQTRVAGIRTPLTIAVMGCAVNGPGEAREADVGVAGGRGQGLIFAKGKILGKAPEAGIVDALMAAIEDLKKERINHVV
jgi:(E)-4-hydroxy-3-methylbut-2-enyl-diphosphate synthase